jgi:3-oxoadipate enol-lactonase
MPYVRSRLGRWFYEERGRPKKPEDAAILLFHSLLMDGGMWRAPIGPLAELGRVINIDGPGHGRSEVPPLFTLEDHATALADVFSELGVDRAVLVGLSWGGMVAMRAALLYPERVRALALFDTSAGAVARADRIKFRLMVSFGRRFGMPLSLVRSQLAPLMFSPRTLRERPELVVEFSRALNGYPREGTARASIAVSIRRKDIVSRLGEIKAPTLVVCGREDRALPPKNSETIASHIAGARLEWIDDAGHVSVLERPEATNPLLLPFVAANL